MSYECAKRKWPTRAKAQEHLVVGKESGHYESGHAVYFCPYCHFFHIGRKRPKHPKH